MPPSNTTTRSRVAARKSRIGHEAYRNLDTTLSTPVRAGQGPRAAKGERVKPTVARLLALSIVVLAASPAAASATITTTQITAPAANLTATYDNDLAAGDPANSATFAGTTDSDAPATDKV